MCKIRLVSLRFILKVLSTSISPMDADVLEWWVLNEMKLPCLPSVSYVSSSASIHGQFYTRGVLLFLGTRGVTFCVLCTHMVDPGQAARGVL